MNAITVEHQSPSRKRQRSAAEAEHLTTQIAQPPAKRTRRHSRSERKENTAYWDSLSRVWLTRAALEELDRRNRQVARSIKRVFAPNRYPAAFAKDSRNPPTYLKRFARHGGPNINDLRGYPEPPSPEPSEDTMPSRPIGSQTNSKTKSSLTTSRQTGTTSTFTTQKQTGTTPKTKKTSPYDPNFEQHIIDHGIFPSGCELPDGRLPPEPKNYDDILEKLKEPRRSLSPSRCSRDTFKAFVLKNSRAPNEDAVMCDVFPFIRGDASIPSAQNLLFGNLEPLTQGPLVDAKPDFYDGTHPMHIDRRLREQFGSLIIPSTQSQAPALANYFLEVKGHDGSGAIAKRQACYHGAIGERGFLALGASAPEDFIGSLENNAHTITSTYTSSSGTLQMYAIHRHSPSDSTGSPEYFMTPLRSISMIDSPERFREGAAAFRNGRDWAKKQRGDLVLKVNNHNPVTSGAASTADTSINQSQSTLESQAPLASQTSEDMADQEPTRPDESSAKRLKTSSKGTSFSPQHERLCENAGLGPSNRTRSAGEPLQKS